MEWRIEFGAVAHLDRGKQEGDCVADLDFLQEFHLSVVAACAIQYVPELCLDARS
jgi:hypothetical protein